ncbi:hypothetical protein BH23BAC2_BH23BAC2_13880 [soil metagenome]
MNCHNLMPEEERIIVHKETERQFTVKSQVNLINNHPYYMRRSSIKISIILLATFLVMGCKNSEKEENRDEQATKESSQLDNLPKNEAGNIVKESIEHAGGWDNWNNKKTLTYTKIIQFVNEKGEVEREVEQLHEYKLKPELKVKISWEEDGDKYAIINNSQQAKKYKNGVALEDEESMNSAWNSSFGSHYVMCMPFKLTDPGTVLKYEGIDTLKNGMIVHAVKTTYEEGAGSAAGKHIWTYYFDKDSYELAGNFLDYGDGYSYTQYEKIENKDGIRMNTDRKSFKANSINDITQLTTNYRNEDIQFDLKMDDAMFEIK